MKYISRAIQEVMKYISRAVQEVMRYISLANGEYCQSKERKGHDTLGRR